MPYTTDLLNFEISVGISLFYLLLCPDYCSSLCLRRDFNLSRTHAAVGDVDVKVFVVMFNIFVLTTIFVFLNVDKVAYAGIWNSTRSTFKKQQRRPVFICESINIDGHIDLLVTRFQVVTAKSRFILRSSSCIVIRHVTFGTIPEMLPLLHSTWLPVIRFRYDSLNNRPRTLPYWCDNPMWKTYSLPSTLMPNAPFTPPTPTRRDGLVASRRRCTWGIRLAGSHADFQRVLNMIWYDMMDYINVRPKADV